ncbi:DNA repair protein XRCC4-like [Galleria mellonella]|uniref:DNA repair protein XRCC4-like n=1 Tax=Galleria mellonella TaxID=7137 RepID=A0A6J1WBX4_GALME|nr:DNA repair protein XRCC4-like [Galleria mellonella]XP_031769674.2 DNA repair protein XRCC4-like [Galleria mellonella]
MESTKPSTVISKINANGLFLYLKVQWMENNEFDLFNIKIFHANSSWSGRFSREFAEQQRNRIDLDEEEYITNIREALEGCDRFLYDFIVQEKEKTATFYWKKKFEDAHRKDGSVPMYRDEQTESIDSLLDHLLKSNRDLKLTIMECNKYNENITKDLNRYKQELKDFVNMKTSIEETLYGKFVQVLNEKKKRIQLLEETLQKFKQ